MLRNTDQAVLVLEGITQAKSHAVAQADLHMVAQPGGRLETCTVQTGTDTQRETVEGLRPAGKAEKYGRNDHEKSFFHKKERSYMLITSKDRNIS